MFKLSKIGKLRSDDTMALGEVEVFGHGRYPEVAITKDSYVIVVYEEVLCRYIRYSI